MNLTINNRPAIFTKDTTTHKYTGTYNDDLKPNDIVTSDTLHECISDLTNIPYPTLFNGPLTNEWLTYGFITKKDIYYDIVSQQLIKQFPLTDTTTFDLLNKPTTP